ncbi:MAG: T9SS type A sorting domain-containing protein [Bacteroidetes bacterium]|nr:T9SS type A sorting domain-containing protein [Bacteroidota bacterium]
MKKIFLLLISLIIIQTTIISQGCLPNGISFSSQSEIDNFQTNYPGCSTIEGDVQISGIHIKNLFGLNSIDTINGSLKIISCSDLDSLVGLNNLKHVGGFFEINANNSNNFRTLNGLDNLKSVGGYFAIVGNEYLLWTSGIESLTSIGDQLLVVFSSLLDLDGLNGVTSINGGLSIAINFSLRDIYGLSNIEASTITDLSIYRNNILTGCHIENICGYLSSPNGVVKIYANGEACDSPSEIADSCNISVPCLPYGDYYFYSQKEIDNFQINFPDCYDLAGSMIIRGYWDTITSIEGLSSINSIDSSLIISSCDSLRTLAGLENLSTIGGALSIDGNDMLVDISSLINLKSIGSELSITNNNILPTLYGLDNIKPESIGEITIKYNSLLSNCAIMSICEYLASPSALVEISTNNQGCNDSTEVAGICDTITYACLPEGITLDSQSDIERFIYTYGFCKNIQGDVQISQIDAVNLEFLNNISLIKGDLIIFDNPNLVDLKGLENLRSIGGDLIIGDENKGRNQSLVSLEGLESLTTIGGTLTISNNSNLNNISSIENISASSIEFLSIYNNPVLSECNIENICNFLISSSGKSDIHDNQLKCNSDIEIESECSSFVEHQNIESFIKIYPNPSNGILKIENRSGLRIDHIRIYDSLGGLVYSQEYENKDLDIKILESGIYTLLINIDDINIYEKLIRL